MGNWGNKLFVRRAVWGAAAALGVAVLLFLFDFVGLTKPFELKAYDGLFYLKSSFSSGRESSDEPLVLIEIDDKTLSEQRFLIPRIMWHNYFSEVIQAVADGGAKVIGLDFLLPRAVFDDLSPGYSRTWLRAILHAKRIGAPVVAGVSQIGDRRIMPEKRYLQIIGPENMGLFNLTTDSDDFCRRQRLFFPGEEGGDRGIYSFAYLLAKNYRPDLPDFPDEVLIDFKPGPAPFPSLSFGEVLAKAEAGDRAYFNKNFQGKLVLIGETNSLTQDRHPTPLYYLTRTGHKRTAGVEIAAHLISGLLAGEYGHEMDVIYYPLFYLLFALPTAIAAMIGGLAVMSATFIITLLVLIAVSAAALSAGLAAPAAGGLAAVFLGQAGGFFHPLSDSG